MGTDRLRFYRVRDGRGYWEPTARMKACGFRNEPCGPDGHEAHKLALEFSARWDAYRKGKPFEPAAPRVPPRALAEAFWRYRKTAQWASKAQSTRLEWLASWRRIEPAFGPMRPSDVTMELIDAWKSMLQETETPDTVWRCIKTWRALWQVAAANGYCNKLADPSMSITKGAAARRKQRWHDGEIARLVKVAWRSGHRGLACIIAVAWDSQLSPGDVRTLTPAHRTSPAAFTLTRAKTGADVVATIGRRTQRLVDAYLEQLGASPAPGAPLFRSTEGTQYADKQALSKAFARLRERVFLGDTRTLMDMRRSGAIEALVGEVDPGALGAKMANTIADARDLQRTYQPVDLAAVRAADEARVRGRRKLRK